MKYTHLVKAIDSASRHLLGRAAAAVNQALVMRNWLVGAYIVEFQQEGDDRAEYGARLLARLADDLRARDVRGLSVQMLERARQFYLVYPQLGAAISSPVVRKLVPLLPWKEIEKKSSPAVRKSREALALAPELLLRFSWTQIIDLIRIDDPAKRAFYENECLKGNWSKRQLQRQIGSLLYERTALSKDYFKNRVMAPGDNPPVGIILCSDKDQTKVEFATAGMDNHLFVSRYLVNLPTAEQLTRFLEQDRARFAALLEQQKAPKALPRPKNRRTRE